MTLADELKEMFGNLNSKIAERENTVEKSELKIEKRTKEETDEDFERNSHTKLKENLNENQKEIMKSFNEFIEFHSELKQLSKNIAKLSYFKKNVFFL